MLKLDLDQEIKPFVALLTPYLSDLEGDKAKLAAWVVHQLLFHRVQDELPPIHNAFRSIHNIQQVIQCHPGLQGMILQGLETQKLGQVRSLETPVYETINYQGMLIQSFRDWVEGAMKLSLSGCKPYSNYGCWIQSHGYGKTRTLLEYSETTYSLGMDFRCKYPKWVRQLLLNELQLCHNSLEEELVMLEFFRIIFSEMNSSRGELAEDTTHKSYLELVHTWQHHSTTDNGVVPWVNVGNTLNALWTSKQRDRSMGSGPDHCTQYGGRFIPKRLLQAGTDAAKALQALIDGLLNHSPSTSAVKLLLYFDTPSH
ncbi:hypothetical protein BD310DRAFT_910458 [Dichomitus squalens]|uniref:Uncharacterized protein n=1 Tax=Dichomitus squalens TaxID=114155 RepID=A0A4Q9PFV8_9APHY|nr:hypothetical protein BD310DRAFT_910458 [Dichomitus squalens]